MSSTPAFTFDEDDDCPVRITSERFQTRDICESFISDWERRTVYYERVDDGERMLLQDAYTKVQRRGWHHFLKMRSGCNQSIVREFYANASHESSEMCIVRGVKLQYNPAYINTILKSEAIPNDFFQTFPITKPKFLRSVAHTITYEGDFVCNCAGNIVGFPVDHLSIEANALRLGVVHRVLPPLHSYRVTVDQGLLIYALLNNNCVDIGQLISREIKKVAKSTNNEGLPYGSLISMLAGNAGVHSRVEDVRYD